MKNLDNYRIKLSTHVMKVNCYKNNSEKGREVIENYLFKIGYKKSKHDSIEQRDIYLTITPAEYGNPSCFIIEFCGTPPWLTVVSGGYEQTTLDYRANKKISHSAVLDLFSFFWPECDDEIKEKPKTTDSDIQEKTYDIFNAIEPALKQAISEALK